MNQSPLFSLSDLYAGAPCGLMAALLVWGAPLCSDCLSIVGSLFNVDMVGTYRMTAVLAGTMTSVSIAVTVMCVNLWKPKWLADFMQHPKAVSNFWAAIFRFTLGTATLLLIAGVGANIAATSPLFASWTVLYTFWLGITVVRLVTSVRYLHLLVAVAVEYQTSVVNTAIGPLEGHYEQKPSFKDRNATINNDR